MKTKMVNRITHIQYKWKAPIEILEATDYYLNSGSVEADDSVSIYEHFEEGSDPIVQFWAFQRNGKRQCFESGESLFDSIDDVRATFSGNPTISRAIISMGWIPWEDELVVEPGNKFIEALGDDFGGEINVSKIKSALKKYPKENLIVFRSIFIGSEEVDLSSIESTPLFSPDSFEPMDKLEAARVMYRSKA